MGHGGHGARETAATERGVENSPDDTISAGTFQACAQVLQAGYDHRLILNSVELAFLFFHFNLPFVAFRVDCK